MDPEGASPAVRSTVFDDFLAATIFPAPGPNNNDERQRTAGDNQPKHDFSGPIAPHTGALRGSPKVMSLIVRNCYSSLSENWFKRDCGTTGSVTESSRVGVNQNSTYTTRAIAMANTIQNVFQNKLLFLRLISSSSRSEDLSPSFISCSCCI